MEHDIQQCLTEYVEREIEYWDFSGVIRIVKNGNTYWETSREEFYYITQKYHYGVPAEDALPQSKALELAQQEAIRLGALPETINARSAEFSYEIGDPDKPLWRILLGRVDRQDAGITLDEWSENNNCEPFVVHLDAYTGQVVKSFMVTDDVEHWEWRY